eukprot:121610-Chlamydomonas_euryale.AAC.2
MGDGLWCAHWIKCDWATEVWKLLRLERPCCSNSNDSRGNGAGRTRRGSAMRFVGGFATLMSRSQSRVARSRLSVDQSQLNQIGEVGAAGQSAFPHGGVNVFKT